MLQCSPLRRADVFSFDANLKLWRLSYLVIQCRYHKMYLLTCTIFFRFKLEFQKLTEIERTKIGLAHVKYLKEFDATEEKVIQRF
jgi:hypothetical protein